MKNEYSTDAAVKAAAAIRQKASTQQPRVGIILGSGLGALAKSIGEAVRIPFRDIPGFPETTVAGEPITTYAPSSTGATAYRNLAKEVLARCPVG